MKNKYNFLVLKFYLLNSEGCNLKKSLGGGVVSWWCFFGFVGLGFFNKTNVSLKRQTCTHVQPLNHSQSKAVALCPCSVCHPLPPEQSSFLTAITSRPGQVQLFG